MTKTMSIRMDQENYKFLTELAKAGKGDLSKAVRELVYRGRQAVHLAHECLVGLIAALRRG